jgi:hypothetical protein
MVNRFPVIAAALAIASFATGTAFSVAFPASARQVVTCESNNNQRNTCSVDTNGSVRLVRQLSSRSCDGNWGYNRNRIWVTNGCRAEFVVEGNNRYNGYNNRYNGYNNRYQR